MFLREQQIRNGNLKKYGLRQIAGEQHHLETICLLFSLF